MTRILQYCTRRRNMDLHFYVERYKTGELYLYIGRPLRDKNHHLISRNVYLICDDGDFNLFGLNPEDYANLKWGDKPVEVFLNMED